jgi:hypothetical protein
VILTTILRAIKAIYPVERAIYDDLDPKGQGRRGAPEEGRLGVFLCHRALKFRRLSEIRGSSEKIVTFWDSSNDVTNLA